MPRDPESLVQWILETQRILMGGESQASYSRAEDDRSQQRSQQGSGQRDAYSDYAPSQPRSDNEKAYKDANDGRAAARQRNQGSGMADVFRS